MYTFHLGNPLYTRVSLILHVYEGIVCKLFIASSPGSLVYLVVHKKEWWEPGVQCHMLVACLGLTSTV